MPALVYDVAVVGAGAAGLMAAIASGQSGARTLLLDTREKNGAKILMSGGTRCNVTHKQVLLTDFQTGMPRTLRNILSAWTAAQTLSFFKAIGVEMVLEETGKFFPSTHSAQTVLNALMRTVQAAGVNFEAPRKVQRISREDAGFRFGGAGFEYAARNLILCTGGLSYPATGSDGEGYQLAQIFGHALVPTSPALTPLWTSDKDWKSLSGLTLECRLFIRGEKEADYTDSFLFTHQGFSGPAPLNISRHWLRAGSPKPEVSASFLPKWNAEKLRAELEEEALRHPRRSVERFLAEKLPARLAQVLLKKSGIPAALIFNQLSRTQREALVNAVLASPLSVNGTAGYAKAEVTAGGVDLAEVDSKTLESKKVPGLFFAGEILDVDGRIGGFNFQWAWSSGAAAARGVDRFLKSLKP